MSGVLLIDGHAAPLESALFSSFHGNSVFTTIKAHNHILHFWPEHWQRVVAHARYFGFTTPDENKVVSEIHDALSTDGCYKVRVILNQHHYALTIEPYSLPDVSLYSGVNIIVSRFQTHPQLATYKTANSLPYLLAQQEAQQQGAFEALLCHPEGHIVDGSRTSPLLFSDDMLIIFDGGLQGVQRNAVINYAHQKNIKSCHQKIFPHELNEGQLLLTNSLLGVVPVGQPKHPFILELIQYFQGQ